MPIARKNAIPGITTRVDKDKMAAQLTQLTTDSQFANSAGLNTSTPLKVRKSIATKTQIISGTGSSENFETPLQRETDSSMEVDNAECANKDDSQEKNPEINGNSPALTPRRLRGARVYENNESVRNAANSSESPGKSPVNKHDAARVNETLLQYDPLTGEVMMSGFSLKSMFVFVGADNLIHCLDAIVHADLLAAAKRASFLILNLETKKMYPNLEYGNVGGLVTKLTGHQTENCDTKESPEILINKIAATGAEETGEATILAQPLPEVSTDHTTAILSSPVPSDKPILAVTSDSDEEYQIPSSRKRQKTDLQSKKVNKTSPEIAPQAPIWKTALESLERLSLKQAIAVLKYEPVTLQDACPAIDRNCIRYIVASGNYGKASTPSFWDNFFSSIPVRARKSNTTVYSNRWRRTITSNSSALKESLNIIGIPLCYLDFLVWFKAHEQRIYGKQHIVPAADIKQLTRKLSEANQLMPLVHHSDDSS